MDTEKESIEVKLLTSFNEQFATNQNHGQIIFIQFLSAILAVLIGYGYVFANTTHAALRWEIIKCESKDTLVSYSIAHLFGTFLISELILTLLATVVANIGYGFRRDQLVIYNIRQKYLKLDYDGMFGKMAYNPRNKNIWDFLPEFNRMFVAGIFVLQIFLIVSFGAALFFFSNWRPLAWYAFIVYVLMALPLLWSIWVYQNYYKKYFWIMTDSNRLYWKKK